MGSMTKKEVLAQIQQFMNSGIDVSNDGEDNPSVNTTGVGSHAARLEALLVLIAGIMSDLNAGSGGTAVQLVRNLYTSTPVNTGGWTQIVADLPGDVSEAYIFDSSGQTLQLGVGPLGEEVAVLLIPPGGTGLISLALLAGQRISLQALSADATAGEIDINFMS